MPGGEDLLVKIGARLTIARNELGMSQASMADALGLSKRAYHSYERGARSIPIECLVTMNRKFGVDLNRILLGSAIARVEHDLKALKEFEISLDRFLIERNLKLRSEKRGAIVERWYASFLDGKETAQEELHNWIDLMAD